jgi:P4 family phage/plasmid primase-like protien
MSEESEMRELYLSQGLKIIPVASVDEDHHCTCKQKANCPNPGKHALAKGWNDPGITINWDDYPDDINIALVTGDQPNGENLSAFDIDGRKGGLETWAQVSHLYPDTRMSDTGGGGNHAIYALPSGIHVRPTNDIYPGVDFKSGNGAYIVLPPSLHVSGLRYRWHDNTYKKWARLEGASLEELIRAREQRNSNLVLPSSTSGGLAGDQLYVDKQEGSDLTRDQVDEILIKGITQGNRNNLIHWLACSEARKMGADLYLPTGFDRLITVISAYNETGCRPPLTKPEIRIIVDSAYKYITSDQANPSPPQIDDDLLAWVKSSDQPGTAVVLNVPIIGTDIVKRSDALSPVRPAGPPVPPVIPVISTPPVLDVPESRALNDRGNAARFVDMYQYDFKYTPETDDWYFWNGHHWVKDLKAQRVKWEIQNIDRIIEREAIRAYDSGDTGLGDALTGWRKKCGMKDRINAIPKLAETHLEIQMPQDQWNFDKDRILAKNGVINLRTGALEPVNKDLYMTESLNFDYHPGLWKRDDEDGRRFRKFLVDITDDDQKFSDWLQKATGYTMTSEISEEVFFFIIGPGNKGKSTYIEVLRTISGTYARILTSDQVTGKRFDDNEEIKIEKFYGFESARLITVSEVPEGARLKSNIVKRLTGGNVLAARKLYNAEPYHFLPRFKIWMESNHKPLIADEPIWRRMRAIPFNSDLINADNADKTLKTWFEGKGAELFLSWAVDGCVRWYQEGLGTCAKVDGSSADYREDEDVIGIFLSDVTTTIDSDMTGCTVGELYDRYLDWVDERKEGRFMFRNFLSRLRDRGFRIDGRSKKSKLYGLMINTAGPSILSEQQDEMTHFPDF